MLSRGHLIGQIVDDLAGIAAQAKQRARLQMFDLHTHIEDFAKEVLNRTLGINLTNLNSRHRNNPGLDLGDEASGWAFQVTADKSTAKIKSTLEKIKPEQRNKYKKIRVLVIGEKQGSYSFTSEPFTSFGFTPEMVWDFNDVCRDMMSLPIESLHDVARYVSSENRRVRLELEIPDEDGRYPTNLDDLIEAIPRPRLTDGSKMESHFRDTDYEFETDTVRDYLKTLSRGLTAVPRQTREVFKFLVERRDEWTGSNEEFAVSDLKIRRLFLGDKEELDGDLALLMDVNLIDYNPRDFDRDVDYWTINFPGKDYCFNHALVKYCDERKIDLRKPFVSLDFSDF